MKPIYMVATVLPIVTASLFMAPTEAAAECLLCHQVQVWNGEEFEWWHWFDLESAEECAENPGEMCRACGWQSQCHGENDPQEGQCHEACGGSFASTISTVETLLADLSAGSDAAPALRGYLAADHRLTYNSRRGAIELYGATASS